MLCKALANVAGWQVRHSKDLFVWRFSLWGAGNTFCFYWPDGHFFWRMRTVITCFRFWPIWASAVAIPIVLPFTFPPRRRIALPFSITPRLLPLRIDPRPLWIISFLELCFEFMNFILKGRSMVHGRLLGHGLGGSMVPRGLMVHGPNGPWSQGLGGSMVQGVLIGPRFV